MSERYQVRPNRVGEWCVVDTRTDCTELIIDEVNAKLAAALLNTQANELREAQVDAAALRVAMKEARKLTLTELNTNFAKVATFSVAFETLMNEALESTTAGADLLRNYEHAQQVFRALEQLVAPFDVADELSIDEKVGIVIDTLEDQSAELRAALIDIRDLDDDGALKTGEIAVEALESTTAGADLLRERDNLRTENAKLRTALEGLMRHFKYVKRHHSFNDGEIVEEFEFRQLSGVYIFDRESEWGRELFAAQEALKGM